MQSGKGCEARDDFAVFHHGAERTLRTVLFDDVGS